MESTFETYYNKIKEKVPESDKNAVLERVRETLSWLDSNQLAETDEYEHEQKELEQFCRPIVSKMYQANGAGPMPTGASAEMPSGSRNSNGPTIEEVD